MADAKKIAKIVVDRDLCIGAASCVVGAGAVFELDQEAKAVIKKKDGTKSSSAEVGELQDASLGDEVILAAVQSCPTKAISLFTEDGSRVYP